MIESARADPGLKRLWLYGLAMLVPTAAFVQSYPLRGNTGRLVDIGKMSDYGGAGFAGYVAGLAVLFLLYGLALREVRRLPPSRALPPVFVCGAALAGLWASLYPVNAIDLFLYTARSRLFTTYGVNPMVALVEDYGDDPLMHVTSPQWAGRVPAYGPLWHLIAAPFTLFGGDRLAISLAGFKLLAVASVMTSGWLIHRYLAVTAPKAAATGVLLYLWNPLVLWEGVGNGHNDVVMVVPLLAALWAWACRADRFVIPALMAATLIKYVPVLLIPVAAVAVWRRADGWQARRRLALWSGFLSLAVVLIGFFPFYDFGAAAAALGEQGDIYFGSPAAMAVSLLRSEIPMATVKHWAATAGLTIVALALARGASLLSKRPDRLPRVAFEVIFLFLLVATWNFRAWYLIWPVALAALLPWGWPAWRTLTWTAGALGGYALWIWGWKWWGTDLHSVHTVAVPLVTGPALLLTLVEAFVVARGRVRDPSPASP